MKKSILLLSVICLWLGMSIVPASAAPNPDEGIFGMAQYFPANTEAFAVMRIDEGFVNDLDNFYSNLSGKLSDLNVPQMKLSQFTQMMLGINLDDMLTWLGDYAAVGQYSVATDSYGHPYPAYMVAILLDDASSADAFLSDKLAGMTRTQDGDRLIYSNAYTELVIAPDLLTVKMTPYVPSDAENILTTDSGSLLESDKYRQAVSELPLDSYVLGVYLDMEGWFRATIYPPEQLDYIDQNLGGLAIGFTSLDANTLVADMAHAPLEATSYDGSGRVDTAFLSKIPDSMGSVAVGNNLSHLISTSLSELKAIDGRMNDALNMPDANSTLATLGIDFQADVLDWMTGDYAVFGDLDVVPIIKDALAYQFNLNDRFHFGVAMDATPDPSAAKNLASHLGDLIAQAPADDSYTIRKDVIAGTVVTVISVHTQVENPLVEKQCNQEPVTSPLDFELVLGANDNLFVFATRPLADQLLTGGYQGIDSTAAYQDASNYFLPDPTSIWFTTGEGFGYSVVLNPLVILSLLGPSIGCIFDNIIAELNGTPVAEPTVTPTPLPTATPDFQQIDRQVLPLEIMQSLVQSASITSTVTDTGVIRVRFVITYKQ